MTHKITGIENATIAKDRKSFEMNLRTPDGPLKLSISAEHLDALITTLQGLEYHASILDPSKGQQHSEQGQVRAEIVDGFQAGVGEVNGVPSLMIMLKSSQVSRVFALPRDLAISFQQALASEISKIKKAGAHH